MLNFKSVTECEVFKYDFLAKTRCEPGFDRWKEFNSSSMKIIQHIGWKLKELSNLSAVNVFPTSWFKRRELEVGICSRFTTSKESSWSDNSKALKAEDADSQDEVSPISTVDSSVAMSGGFTAPAVESVIVAANAAPSGGWRTVGAAESVVGAATSTAGITGMTSGITSFAALKAFSKGEDVSEDLTVGGWGRGVEDGVGAEFSLDLHVDEDRRTEVSTTELLLLL